MNIWTSKFIYTEGRDFHVIWQLNLLNITDQNWILSLKLRYTLLHVGSWRGMNIHISQTMCLRLFKTLSWDINNPKHYSVLYGPWTNMGWYDSNCNIGSRRHLGAIKIILASSRLRHVVFHVISQIRNLTWLRIKRLRRLK